MNSAAHSIRWLFGDQLGPHFLDAPDQPVVMVESRAVFARRRFHRQKAHLVLSAMRHRAAELGDQCRYLRADTYRQALESAALAPSSLDAQPLSPLRPPLLAPSSLDAHPLLTVCHPTTRGALALVHALGVQVLPARGYATSMPDFRRWADERTATTSRGLLMEDFYRGARRRLDVLMEGAEPAGGRWNFDADNRARPPKGVPTLPVVAPFWPEEDEIDAQVRRDLDQWERDGDVSFVGRDGPRRFAATRAEALAALETFVANRLSTFGPYEDAMLADDDWMAHSLLSAPMNLGLLDPLEAVSAAEDAYRSGTAPIASVEGYIRQLIGWRDYVWHLYWYEGADYRRRNALGARKPLPAWFADLDADAVDAHCLSDVLRGLRDHGWVHHIPRLMVLGNYAMQRGWDPGEVFDWFHRCFVDGYEWVMVPNGVGMSQYADGGIMATKPYAAGGAYIDRMSNYCSGCRYDPKQRVGDDACPYTAGYWWFLARNRGQLTGNRRLNQPLRGLDRLGDLDALVEQESQRGSVAP